MAQYWRLAKKLGSGTGKCFHVFCLYVALNCILRRSFFRRVDMDEVGGRLEGHRIVEVAPGRWLGNLLLAFRIRSQYPVIRKPLRLPPRDIFRVS